MNTNDKQYYEDRRLFGDEKPDCFISTKAKLAQMYGIPGTRQEGKLMIRVINQYLSNFEDMYQAIEEACTYLKIDSRQALIAVCKFAEISNDYDMAHIAKKVRSLLDSWKAGKHDHKSNFIRIIEKLNAESLDPKFNYYDVISYFHGLLNVSKYTVGYKSARYCKSAKVEDNNPLFEDNNN